ncbi:MAG: helicase [Rubrobacteraceae bacterium]|nr:helicase [Rubrobacteraceae bacterium]
MTETVKLPVALNDCPDPAHVNERLKSGVAELDWTRVRDAPVSALVPLLSGLDLSRDADALGLETIPEELEDAVVQVLENGARDETRTTAQAPPMNGAPEVWEADREPVDGAVGEEPAVQAAAERADASGDSDASLLTPPSQHQIRDELERLIVADLLGPAGGPEEEVAERRVSERYATGMLAPRRQRLHPPEEFDELAVGGGGTAEDGTSDVSAPQSSTAFPSSLGMTFSVAGDAESIQITARWGRYRRAPSASLKSKDDNLLLVWKREPVEAASAPVTLSEGELPEWTVTEEQPEVVVRGTVRQHDEHWIVSLFLINGQREPKIRRDEAWIFQPELIVASPDGAPIFRQRPRLRDPASTDRVAYEEERAMAMVYRRHVGFAAGHNTSVHADTDPENPRRAVRVKTTVIPRQDVPRTTPPTQEDIPALADLVLDMKELSETPTSELPAKLAALPDAYRVWIEDERRKLSDPKEDLAGHAEAAERALENCARTLERIRAGISLLSRYEKAAEAFRFANRAMWLQRTRSIYAEEARRGGKPDMSSIDVPQNRSWYPFQLAFILLNLPGLSDPRHPERSDTSQAVADLLWFPTGGGKTEAYLGLSAYAMGLRRLQGTVAGRSGESGIAVLMRYTLRLLTLQQFQRASALVCACESIRREAIEEGDARWGAEPFRIGLWVGQRATPNTTKDAEEAVKKDHGSYGGSGGTPAQLLSCPWCGSEIDRGKHIKVEAYPQGAGRTITYCGDPLGRCPFSERKSPGEGIPVVVVDEEIYRRLPALLISTVDKFAQMPWNGATQMLFGQVDGRCDRHGFRSPEIEDSDSHPKKGTVPAARSTKQAPLRPPDLIIQDELHLISGPLGTLVGLYETAVDQLCAWEVDGKRVRPKVVASTATIRRAPDQVYSLFTRDVEIFPPQGTDVRDNFFSRQREPGEEYSGRRYLGICAPGKRLKAALIRVYVAHLAAAQKLYEKYGKTADPWMTLVGYFNSMRELGGMRRLVDDDVRLRLQSTESRGLANRKTPSVEELTSRRSSADIPRILDRLETTFDPAQEKLRRAGKSKDRSVPLDVLLATNMISVGVDVSRLGSMVVAGQPKTTAEYIQATSRVGRSAPGLVCTVFNWARARDLSHYERFEHYHATFYQYVEALSVTPFAARALDRGLTALLVALVRLADDEYNENSRAEDLNRNHALVKDAVEAIVRRAEEVNGSKEAGADVRRMLERRIDEWRARADNLAGGARLGYKKKNDGVTRGLLHFPSLGEWDSFTCLNSLRDVEPTVSLILSDHGLDEEAPARTDGATV